MSIKISYIQNFYANKKEDEVTYYTSNRSKYCTFYGTIGYFFVHVCCTFGFVHSIKWHINGR